MLSSVYKNVEYASSTAVLEAYIGDHVGESSKWQIRSKYQKELEDLLIQEVHQKAQAPENLRQLLEVTRAVDETYDKLRAQNKTFTSQSASEQLLTEITQDNLSPLSSNTHLPSTSFRPRPFTSAASSAVELSTRSANHKPREVHTFDESSLSYSPAQSLTERSSYISKLPRYLNKSWLDASVASLHDDLHDGYHSDSSVSVGHRDNSFLSSDARRNKGGSLSHSAPQSPIRNQAKTWETFGKSEFPMTWNAIRSKQSQLEDDTLLHLVSSRKSLDNVPSWVRQLEDERSVSDVGERPVGLSMDEVPQWSSHENCLSPLRKQLRFDMNLSQSSLQPHNRQQQPDRKQPEFTDNSLLRTSILKSSPPKTSGLPSLTTEDISSSLYYGRRPIERTNHVKHQRSFSANARLSSTPIKSANQDVDQLPHISGLSSVHTANTQVSKAECWPPSSRHNVGEYGRGMERPFQYLYDAVSEAESKSLALGVFDLEEALWRKPPTAPKNRQKPAEMRAEHQVYLRSLARDIEDRSSSVVTGFTELQDIMRIDPVVERGLVTPIGQSTRPAGLELTPNTDMILNGDRSWEKPISRRLDDIPRLTSEQAGSIEDFLQDCKVPDPLTVMKEQMAVNTDVEKPGTMESLKNMLFTMQSMTNVDDILASGDHENNSLKKVVDPDDILSPSTKSLVHSAVNQGGDSLQRAMVHLDRLKTMVKSKDTTK